MQAQAIGTTAWVGLGTTTFRLVLLNAVAFLLWQLPALQPGLAAHATLTSSALADGHLWALVTHGFSHLGFWHLLWNMAFLLWFGRDLEVLYGGRNLLALYLFGALGGGLLQVAVSGALGQPLTLLGATGGVLAVGAASLLFSPRRRVHVLGLLPVPLWLLFALFLALDLGGTLRSVSGLPDGLPLGTHAGGALAGVAFKLFDLRPFSAHRAEAASLGAGLLARLGRGLRRGGPVPLDDRRGTPRTEPRQPAPDDDAAFSARVDDVLRQVHERGLESLSPEERALLEEASRRWSGRHRRALEGS
jgi:membrane associated rhomboid family serine protease